MPPAEHRGQHEAHGEHDAARRTRALEVDAHVDVEEQVADAGAEMVQERPQQAEQHQLRERLRRPSGGPPRNARPRRGCRPAGKAARGGARKSAAPLMRWRIDTSPGSGRLRRLRLYQSGRFFFSEASGISRTFDSPPRPTPAANQQSEIIAAGPRFVGVHNERRDGGTQTRGDRTFPVCADLALFSVARTRHARALTVRALTSGSGAAYTRIAALQHKPACVSSSERTRVLARTAQPDSRPFRSPTMAKQPVRVAVTGAAGQIGYSLLFRIATGDMLGKDQPVILQLLEIPTRAQPALKGVMMELEDCAFPLLAGMVADDDPKVAFKRRGRSAARRRAAAPKPGWSGRTCWKRTRRSSPSRVRRSTRSQAGASRCWSSAIPRTRTPSSR